MARHVVIAGAGIVGLAVGRELALTGRRVTVVDKEVAVATHQTGNNSGVIHSGLYYKPGSLKARLAVTGAESMREYAADQRVPVDICGKLVVATKPSQIPALNELLRRGVANGVPCRLIDPDEAAEHEPAVACIAALRVDTTGIVDYVSVCQALRREIEAAGGVVRLGEAVTGVETKSRHVRVTTSKETISADAFVNCAGLQSDKLARVAGLQPDARIVPFRGEYFELAPQDEHRVRGLIYPVPDPELPFLGVHLTRMINGTVHAGPNAVFALSREGYRWRDVSVPDLLDSVRWPGLWRLGRRFWRVGLEEISRSISPSKFLASARELVPSLGDHALVPTHAGVRAQAVRRDGSMVDDFLIQSASRQIHVLNAPSPAATAALEIGKYISRELEAVVV